MALRIISGRFRRRILKTPPDQSTRPYTDRVRQIVFDRLGEDRIVGARVADVFAGVGTMGMESLSRGAATCVFIEAGPDVYPLLRENVQTIAPDVPTVCWRTDVRRTSFRPKNADECLPYTLVFFDPPYAMFDQMLPGKPLSLYDSLTRIARDTVTTADADLLIRTSERDELPPHPAWAVFERWDVSTMTVWRMRKPAAINSTALDAHPDEADEAAAADEESSGSTTSSC